MKKKKAGSLFRKYMIKNIVLILVSLIIMGTLFLVIEAKSWNDEQTSALLNNTRVVADNVENLIRNYSGNTISEVARPIHIISNTLDTISSANDCDIFICDEKGDVVVCREMSGKFNTDNLKCDVHSSYNIPEDILRNALKGDYSELTTLGGTFPLDRLVVATPIQSGNGSIGAIFCTKQTVPTWSSYAKRIGKIMLISASVALLFSVAVTYGMVYEITKPLRDMVEATRHYAEGDFSYKVKIKRNRNDEMVTLVNAFNKMASSLASLESSRRNFVANVSHELKTPMTTIGGFIEGILDGTIPPEQEKHYLEIVHDEVKRLSRLVVGMLNMTKLEAGEMKINKREFDFAQDVFRTLLTFEKKINQKSIEIIGLDTMENVIVSADEDMLMQVIYNLIDNAIKFTPEGGYIAFSAFVEKNRLYVSVKNSGDGVSEEELSKIFERFYKIDKSRSYDVKGAGLGLYIVKSIITLHEGEIKAASVPGEYTDFSFWIPVE